jgi:hypothetical protein
MTRTARPLIGTVAAAIALILMVVACGNVTLTVSTPTPAGLTPAPGVTQPAGGGASGAIVSAADLEATLPSTLCGQPSTKGSATGTGTVSASAPPNPFSAFTGGSASGAFAWADPTAANCQTSAVALAAVGPLAGIIMSAIALSAMGSGSGSQITLGGKLVYKIVDTPTSLYVYAKGAVLYGVQAATDDDAAAALQQMP